VIPFHRVLIGAGIVFCAGFALWALSYYVVYQRPWQLAMVIVFGLFAVALGYYLANLKRFIGR
jgi:hypothetical protein